jgi:hypothetical protein
LGQTWSASGEHSKELTWISPHCSLSWSLFYSWVAAAGTAVDAGTKEQDARSNTKAMSRVPWHLFQDRKPHAHFVVGAIVQANGPASLNDSTVALAVLRRLARKQKPIGDYAATVVKEAGWPEVYFAFADEADAQKLGASVRAEPIASYPGWAGQRAFAMDSAMIRELEAALPPARMQPKQPPSDHPRFRRGGPRAASGATMRNDRTHDVA